jgi:hypothetical protein
MKKYFFYVCLLLVVVPSSNSYGQRAVPPPPPRDPSVDLVELFGDLDGRTYTNRFFGFKMKVPDEFTILDRTEIKIYNDAGADLMKSKDESGTSKLDEAVQRSINILVITKMPPGRPGNSAVEFVTARQATGVTSKMVLAETVKVMTATGTFTATGSLAATKFGGLTFVGVDLESTAFGIPLSHRTYVTMVKNYALVITMTLQKDTLPDEFERLLRSIETEKNRIK